jgi:hypothetical protein
MRRVVIAVVAFMSLGFGSAVALAHGQGGPGGGGQNWGGGGQSSPKVAVAGTIVSVDTTNNTIVANAYELGQRQRGWQNYGGNGGHRFGSHGHGFRSHSRREGPNDAPATTQVTISTTGTTITINGQPGTLGGLGMGDTFRALFNGSPGTDITTLVANPPVWLSARVPPQLYAFVGTVTSTTPATSGPGGTVDVDVTNSLPSGLIAPGTTVPFTVGPDTLILGGNATDGLFGGTFGGISTGDVVAGGLVAAAGDTVTQIESIDLRLLIDFGSGGATPAIKQSTKAKALKRAAKLLGIKADKSHKSGKADKSKKR